MATIVVSASAVIEAAQRTIEAVKLRRDTENEKTIAYYMQPRKFLWFKLKPRTREGAIHEARMAWEYPCTLGHDILIHAKKLLTLAQHGDPVTLNEEDCRVLF